MVEDNFWKCSTCCRFSEIFQCVINRRICRENPDSKPSYERKNIGQIYQKHKLSHNQSARTRFLRKTLS